jgi:hypothetical protein
MVWKIKEAEVEAAPQLYPNPIATNEPNMITFGSTHVAIDKILPDGPKTNEAWVFHKI